MVEYPITDRLRCSYNGRDFSGPAPSGTMLPTAIMKEAADEIERLITEVARLTARGWIQTAEALPVSSRKVIAFYKNANGKPRRIMAFYAAKFDIESSEEDQLEAYEYSEAKDQYFLCEGWYENNEFDEINWRVDGEITHWMPLPDPPSAESAR